MDTQKITAPTDSLFRRGVLLVLVPAIIQLIGFYELSNLMRKTERLEEMTATNARMTTLMDEIQLTIANGFAALIAEGSLGNKQHIPKPEVLEARLDKEFAELEQLSAGDKISLETLARIKDLAYSQFKMTAELTNFPAGPFEDALPTRMHVLRIGLRKLGVLKFGAESKRKEQQAIFDQRRQQYTLENKELKTRIAIEMSVTFLLTFASILLFLRSITQRLSVLVANTKSLASKDAKFRPVSGSDEIAFLNDILKQTKTDLIAANEHRASLIQTVSHDIRSPLLSARLAVNKLANACAKQAPSLVTQANSIGSLVDKILKFAEDLLSIERMDQVEMELEIGVIDIVDLVEESIRSVESIIEAKEIRIKREIEPISLVVDCLRIEQVVSNLLSNAIKFSPLRGEIKIVGKNSGKIYAVRVSDQGPGVQASDQSKIFDKFFTSSSKGSQSGFGVGLAISKEIVRKHGGDIGAVSKPGESTTFWFTLPIDEEDMGHMTDAATTRVSTNEFIDR